MNLLQKQGFLNSIILYVGTALGFFNLIILFQRYLSIEEIGFFNLLIAITGIYTQITSLGVASIVLRYFPYYRSNDRKHGGFLTFIVLVGLLSFLVFTVLYLIFKDFVIAQYLGKVGAALFIKYYYYVIPVSLFTLAFVVLESITRAIFKNILSAFLKEVLLRVFTSISVLCILVGMFNYQGFIVTYAIANATITALLGYYIYVSKLFKWANISREVKKNAKQMISYGLFTVLAGSSFMLLQNMDMLMLSLLTKQSLAYVGVYATFFSMAVVISFPARALNRTSYQIISEAWKEGDLVKIKRIYKKTSIVQSLIGAFILTSMVINRENILWLLHKPNYALHFNVFILVGFAFWIDVTGGLNGLIISFSKYYRWVTFAQLGAVALCILLNFWFIPRWGMIGAAIAYLSSVLSLNFFYWLFLKAKLGLQPFDKAYIVLIFINIASCFIGLSLPRIANFYIDVAYRTAIISLFYVSLTLMFKVSTDINAVIKACFNFKRLKEFFG